MRCRTFSLFFAALAMLAASVAADAQNLALPSGRWEGALPPKDTAGKTHEMHRRPDAPAPVPMIVFIVRAIDGTYTGNWMSTGQKGPTEMKLAMDGETIRISAPGWRGVWEGKLGADGVTLDGEWRQGGRTTPLVLRRTGEANEPVRIDAGSGGVIMRR